MRILIDVVGERGRPNLRWKEAGRKEDDTTNSETGQHGEIRSSAILAAPDDRTSQGRRRRKSFKEDIMHLVIITVTHTSRDWISLCIDGSIGTYNV